MLNHKLCIAPMMDWTDRHQRVFIRLISRHALLYTEMITAAALIYGDCEKLLRHDRLEHPLAIQLGGSNPGELSRASKLAESAGYKEINLNVGCPSDRVQSGSFGACLMAQPNLVANCISAMQDTVDIPVTVKCRIGIDNMDSYAELANFISRVAETGCQTFILHARIAHLQGLSPKQNREVPPLNYDRIYAIKENFSPLEIIINGGIKSLQQAQQHLSYVDGVMIGREAYHNPYCLAYADQELFACQQEPLSRHEILKQYLPYVEKEIASGIALKHISRHIPGLFRGMPGAKQFRRHLSENAYKDNADINVIITAMNMLRVFK